jgi:acyl-CoA synthetase (AMP-forming)/AMP-acid ligase II
MRRATTRNPRAAVYFVFDPRLRLAPSSVAVIQGDTTLIYRELDTWCSRTANARAGLGVGAGRRVALMFSNDWRFLPAFFGPMRIGAVSVPLNIRMGDDALAYVIGTRKRRRWWRAETRPSPPAAWRARSRAWRTSSWT